MRYVFALFFSITFSLGLFFFMSQVIIEGHSVVKSNNSLSFVDFIKVKPPSKLKVRKRVLPKRIQPPKPPKMKKMNIKKLAKIDPLSMKGNIPGVIMPSSFANSFDLNDIAAGNSANREVMPIVRIAPQYPRKAAMAGIEGWVLLRFDINILGVVENVEIIKSQPNKIFDGAARRALLKWKYKAKLIDGKPVKQVNNNVKIEFKLEA